MENEVTVVSFTKNDLIPIQHRLVVVWFTKEDKDYFEDPKYPTLEELKLFTLSNPSCNALHEYAVWFLQKYSHVDHKPRSVSLRSFNGVSSDVVTKVLSQGDGKWEYEREKARKVRDERIRIERELSANKKMVDGKAYILIGGNWVLAPSGPQGVMGNASGIVTNNPSVVSKYVP